MNDKASKIKGLSWVAFTCVCVTLLFFGLSPLVYLIPWRWETRLASIFPSTASQEYIHDPQVDKILQKIVQRIYPLNATDQVFKIKVYIIKNKAINAHAELGGKILINSSLINQAKSPEEIAAVLAHEIEHIHHRDILKSLITYIVTTESIKIIFYGKYLFITDLTNFLFNMRFTRTQESAADKAALLRLQKSHVDNLGFKNFFSRMENEDTTPDFLSDHPSNQSRLAYVDKFRNQNVTPILTKDDWQNFKTQVRLLSSRN
jgi:predicted Zn-dependent protease